MLLAAAGVVTGESARLYQCFCVNDFWSDTTPRGVFDPVVGLTPT